MFFLLNKGLSLLSSFKKIKVDLMSRKLCAIVCHFKFFSQMKGNRKTHVKSLHSPSAVNTRIHLNPKGIALGLPVAQFLKVISFPLLLQMYFDSVSWYLAPIHTEQSINWHTITTKVYRHWRISLQSFSSIDELNIYLINIRGFKAIYSVQWYLLLYDIKILLITRLLLL